LDGATTTYNYDPLGQLLQAGASTFGYDPSGNRTNTGDQTTAGNQLSNDGTWTYTYDLDGQLIAKSKGPSSETWSFGYDARGQLLWAEDRASPGGSLLSLSTYSYDVFGDRIQASVWTSTSGTTATSRFAVDLQGNDWADLDGSNALVDRHLFLDAS